MVAEHMHAWLRDAIPRSQRSGVVARVIIVNSGHRAKRCLHPVAGVLSQRLEQETHVISCVFHQQALDHDCRLRGESDFRRLTVQRGFARFSSKRSKRVATEKILSSECAHWIPVGAGSQSSERTNERPGWNTVVTFHSDLQAR